MVCVYTVDVFVCDILYWFCLVSILVLLWMIGRRCHYKDQDAHIFCNICADGERAVIVLCSTCTNPGKSIVVPCLHCFGCGQVKLVLNSAKCFVANDPWTSVSSTFVGCIVYPASGCDYVRLVWQGLMPLRSSNTTDWYIAMCFLSVPSSLIFVCGHLAFLWPILHCEKDWALYNCCTYVYTYIYIYVCVNVTRLYKRCITDPMDVVTYSGNLLGWRGANAIGNGKGSVEMSAGAPQGLGMLGKL